MLPDDELPLDRAIRNGAPGRGRWIAIGIVLALILGAIGALTITQTDWGRAQVLTYTVRTLGGRLNGELTVQRAEGNLFSGARLYDLVLADLDGAPLAVIDSAYIQYRVATFLGGDVVINRAVLFNARIDIFRMPGDTAWNYQEILRDPTPDPTDPADAGAALIEQLELHSTEITVRGPFEPDPGLPADEQRLVLEAALADTARWMIEEVPGGYVRTMLIGIPEARLSELFIGPDQRGGIYLEVNDAVADIRLWRDPPLEIREAEAQLHLREGIINYQAPRFALPNTRGESVGRIDLTGDKPMYDVVFTMPAFAVADIRWLYPWLPDDPAGGRGSMRLWVEDRPDDSLILAHDLVLRMPGTEVTGSFGMLVGDVLRFVDVDLQADPLDVDDLERLLPGDLPVEGLEIGGAVIRGEG